MKTVIKTLVTVFLSIFAGMGFASKYLHKHQSIFQVTAKPDLMLTPMVVVIPCYNEPEILKTIKSIAACNETGTSISIVVVVNHGTNAPQAVIEQNIKTAKELRENQPGLPPWLHLVTIEAYELPHKHAGAGYARKIGMDWAISHFNNFNCADGIVISLDADCTVAPNYLEEIRKYFNRNPAHVAATLYFEHDNTIATTTEAITLYELYLRYYKHAVDFTGFPFSLYTVGSAFAVKANAYVAQGGMNRKKAGEDFYFLHKLTPYGSIGAINSTTVYPSSRLSDRVPFGTGPALKKFLSGENELNYTYPFDAFQVLKTFFQQTKAIYNVHSSLGMNHISDNQLLNDFLGESGLLDELEELKANCSHLEVFQKRFFHVFNSFKILKWLNYYTLKESPKQSLLMQAKKLLLKKGFSESKIPNDPNLMLKLFRDTDKAQTFN